MLCLGLLRQPVQSGFQAQVVENGRADIKGQGVRILDALLNNGTDFIKQVFGGRRCKSLF